MKVYTRTSDDIIRVQITRQGEQAEYINITDATAAEVEKLIKDVITSQGLSPFQTCRATSLVIRNAVGGKNGKSKSVSFKGLSPKQTIDLLVRAIEAKSKSLPK